MLTVPAVALALLVAASGCSAQQGPGPSAATAPSSESTRPSTDSPAAAGSATNSTRDSHDRQSVRTPSSQSSMKSSQGKASSSSSGRESPPPGLPPAHPKSQKSVLKKLPGSTEAGKCVAVGPNSDVTSGTVAMGNFQRAKKLYKSQFASSQQPTVNFYVIPSSRAMPGLEIKLTRIGAKGSAHTVHSRAVQKANVWKYYSVHMAVPSPGKWRLMVKSGSDKGCFEVSFLK
ncbi:hypothetical protein BJY26_003457 [Spelaeicoccus albus]|uniref:Uncharacterized protein n=1 Tax=Spelaeicoccus albus TaxID=1280376 RepID=A0A7Z0D5K7_9MICO|nr:hypothetical protein [Spelaeicoccus albus]